jgi:hypothetical protein
MEDGAVEAVEVAAILTKEVFNPIAKLTKGFQNVVLAKGQNQQQQQVIISAFYRKRLVVSEVTT